MKAALVTSAKRRLVALGDGTWDIEIPHEDPDRGWESCSSCLNPREALALFLLAVAEDLLPHVGDTARLSFIREDQT